MTFFELECSFPGLLVWLKINENNNTNPYLTKVFKTTFYHYKAYLETLSNVLDCDHELVQLDDVGCSCD